VFGEWGHLSFNPRTSVALVYLAVAGSLVAFAAYSRTRFCSTWISRWCRSYTYINPVIAVALGVMLLGEAFSHVRMLVAAAVILVGVVIVGPATRARARS
jgi:drug/metabolite transporter (DMT)-like permease